MPELVGQHDGAPGGEDRLAAGLHDHQEDVGVGQRAARPAQVLEARLHVDQGDVGLLLDGRPEDAAHGSVATAGSAGPRLGDPHGVEQGDVGRGPAPYSASRSAGVMAPSPPPTTSARGSTGTASACSRSSPRLMARLGLESVSMASTRLPRSAYTWADEGRDRGLADAALADDAELHFRTPLVGRWPAVIFPHTSMSPAGPRGASRLRKNNPPVSVRHTHRRMI